ncbi:MAG TPA: FecR domain-containing protein [Kofleriaceae bacterium]|jgi:TolA-binding protein
MSCPSSELLSRFVADGIDPAIAAHLVTCDMCSAEVEAHRAVSDDVSLLPVYEPSPEHVRDVRAALLAAARIPAPAPVIPIASRRNVVVAGAVLAAAAIALLVVRPFAAHHDVTAVYRSTIHPHDGAQFIRVGGSPDEIVRLTRGTITVEVATLEARERFRVITDDSEVEVRGTAFDVTASNDHLSAVHVLHGKVEVRTTGSQAVFLGEGERWQPTLARAEDVLPGSGSAAPSSPDVAAPTTQVTAVDESGTERNLVASETTTQFPSPKRAPKAPTTKHAAKAVAVVEDSAKTPSSSPTTSNDNSASGSNAAAATQQIAASAVAPSSTPKRPNELEFDKGWQALNGGNFNGAATAFEQAAKAAPNDPLAEDAWFWRASALTRAKSSSATGALDAFVSRYPHSPRAGEASAMLGWLLLDRDPDRAEKLFSAASNDRVAAVAASGKKGLAAVAQKRSNAK